MQFAKSLRNGDDMESKIIRMAAMNLTGRLNRYAGKSGLELRKLELGMEIALINVSKLAVVYLLALLLGVVVQTFIVSLAFAATKRYSFGLHALNSTVCTLVSCLMLVVVPWALQGVGISNIAVMVMFVPIVVCLYLYAPADTNARPLVGPKNRARLKKKAVAIGVVLMLVALVVPSGDVKLLIVLGVVLQCVAIMPLSYKILRRRGRNYEQFEC